VDKEEAMAWIDEVQTNLELESKTKGLRKEKKKAQSESPEILERERASERNKERVEQQQAAKA